MFTELAPLKLPGLTGMSAAVIPLADARLFLFGGSPPSAGMRLTDFLTQKPLQSGYGLGFGV